MESRTELHPVELLILAALALADALAVLLVSAVALLLTLTGWRPARPAPAPLQQAPATAPVPSHPTLSSDLGRAVILAYGICYWCHRLLPLTHPLLQLAPASPTAGMPYRNSAYPCIASGLHNQATAYIF